MTNSFRLKLHDDSECEGCTKIKNFIMCYFYEKVGEHCPCKKCLVKVTCETNCEERIRIVRKYTSHRIRERGM